MKLIALSLALLMPWSAKADTVHFARGHWNGIVTFNGVNFVVESHGTEYSYRPSDIKQIEFNDIVNNPDVAVCPAWKRLLLLYPECGIESMFGLIKTKNPDGSTRPDYRPAEPPRIKRSSSGPRAKNGMKGTHARIEFNDGAKPLVCVLLEMSTSSLTIDGEKSISRRRVRSISPQENRAQGK